MSQSSQQNNSFDQTNFPVKRKRGRPRKDENPGFEPSRRIQQQRQSPHPIVGPGLVGQSVTGILDGVFDAGFLITVRVGNNGPLLRGMVFDSQSSVPISAGNDIAPRIKMSKRDEIPIPATEALRAREVPLQMGEPAISQPIMNRVVLNDDSHGESSVVSVQAAPVNVPVSEHQRVGSAGGMQSDSASQLSSQPDTPSLGFRPEHDLNEGPDQLNSSTSHAEAQASSSQTDSDVLQGTTTTTNAVGNGNSQVTNGGAI